MATEVEAVPVESVAAQFKALSHPVRLQVLMWLSDPRGNFPIEKGIADPDEYGVCVSQISDKLGLAQSTVSAYMANLERAGLVTSTRVGTWTHYRRNEDRISALGELLAHSI